MRFHFFFLPCPFLPFFGAPSAAANTTQREQWSSLDLSARFVLFDTFFPFLRQRVVFWVSQARERIGQAALQFLLLLLSRLLFLPIKNSRSNFTPALPRRTIQPRTPHTNTYMKIEGTLAAGQEREPSIQVRGHIHKTQKYRLLCILKNTSNHRHHQVY